jgi:type IV secretory pathway TraG/TraD family ATPase VirD4
MCKYILIKIMTCIMCRAVAYYDDEPNREHKREVKEYKKQQKQEAKQYKKNARSHMRETKAQIAKGKEPATSW